MDPMRFLDLATVLKGGSTTAENCRTAIGRAYYAAFNVGVEALRAIGIQPSRNPSGHGELRNCLGACNDPDLRKANAHFGGTPRPEDPASTHMSDPVVETRRRRTRRAGGQREVIDVLNKLIHDASLDSARSEMKRYARGKRLAN